MDRRARAPTQPRIVSPPPPFFTTRALVSRDRRCYRRRQVGAPLVELMGKKILLTMEGLDGRVSRIERLLPQLATKADLEGAIAAAVAPLATKAELEAAIAPLATKAELRAAIAAAIEPLATRSEMLALHESLKGDIQLLADSVLSLHAKFDARF